MPDIFSRTYTSLRQALGRSVLASPGFAAFLFGVTFNMAGRIIVRTTFAWMVFDLSGSNSLLGLMGLIAGTCALFSLPFASAAADRYGRVPSLRWSTSAVALLTLVVAGMGWAGILEAWHILVAMALITIGLSVQGPAIKGLIPRLVTPEKTSGGLALNAMSYELSRSAGPVVAGFVIGAAGAPFALLLFPLGAVVWLLSLTRVPRKHHRASGTYQSILQQWKEAWVVVRQAGLVPCFVILLIGGLLLGPMMNLMPALADFHFGNRPEAFGGLMGAFGAGAFAGAVWILFHKSQANIARATVTQALFASAVGLLALSGNYLVSLGMAFLAGVAFMITALKLETQILANTPDTNRGVASGAISFSQVGASSLASFLCGVVADIASIRIAWAGFAGAALAFLVLFRIVRELRSDR